MKVKVKAKDLCSVLDDFVKGTKVMFNFLCNGKSLDIQILNEYTVEVSINVVSDDGDYTTQEISVYLTKAIHILSKEEDITLTFTDACLELEQGTFSCMLLREFEARRECKKCSDEECVPLSPKLRYLVGMVQSMSSLSKELKVLEPDPVFLHGHYYHRFTSTVFRETFEFPECSISLRTLKDVVYRFSNKAKYHFFKENSSIYVTDIPYKVWIPTVDYNVRGNEISVIDKKIDECQSVGFIDINPYVDRFKIMADAFASQKLILTIGKDAVMVSLNAVNANLMIGDIGCDYLFSISITSGQLGIICKMFKDDERIEVFKGGNAICLRSNETKNLLILGSLC